MKPNPFPRPIAPSSLAGAVSPLIPLAALFRTALSCAVLVVLVQPVRAAVAEAWVQRYSGLGIGDNRGNALVVDKSGNVVITGNACNGFKTYFGGCITDSYTAKYAATSGALLWEKRHHGPNSGWSDGSSAVAVDADGNVVVTGGSAAAGLENGFSDMYTAKYAAADGALIWEKRYNDPTKYDDWGTAVAVDSSGDVVVTGHSDNRSRHPDFYTAKYARADGALLWEKRHSPGEVTAMALDGGGNVVVTGSSYDSTTSFIYTAKYAAADGSLLWEHKLLGYAAFSQSVTVDGNGHVLLTLGLRIGSAQYGPDDSFYTAKSAIVILRESGVGWEQAKTGADGKAWRLESMLRREI